MQWPRGLLKHCEMIPNTSESSTHLSKFIPTRKSLLSRLKNWNDQGSWKEFFDTYWRLIYNTARKAGLSDAEAQDVVQETVISVYKNIPGFEYDPKRCSFKTWLLRLVHWRIVDQIRKRLPGLEHAQSMEGMDPIEGLPDKSDEQLEKIWQEEWESYLIDRGLATMKGRVNPKHFQVFHLVYVRQYTVAQVAKELGVTRTWVYLVKHRLSKMFENEIQKLNQGPDSLELSDE